MNERDERILSLKAQGRSLREIAGEMGISRMTAKRVLDRYKCESVKPDVTANVTAGCDSK